MDKLFEEYNRYEEIIQSKKEKEEELLRLSGDRRVEAIKRINEISSSLGKLKEEEDTYNKENIEKIGRYFKMQNDFNRICKDIRAVESLSKKSQKEKIEVHSAEGRKRKIDKSLVEDYQTLVREKNKLRPLIKREYENIKAIKTLKTYATPKEEIIEAKETEFVFPKIETYDDLSIEDKIKETKKRIERIFNLSTLPNQGKKIIVTYEGKRRPLARKYQGYYKETIKDLGLLQSKIKKQDSSKEIPKEEEKEIAKAPLVEISKLEKKKETPIQKTNRWFSSEEDERIFSELFKDCPPAKQDKIYAMLFSKYATERKNALLENLNKRIEKEPSFTQQVKLAKAKVLSIGKNIKDKLSMIGTKIKDKSAKVSEDLKSGVESLKEKQEKTKASAIAKVGDLEYEIVSRTINLKSNTCQKVSGIKTKITSISKKDLLTLQIKFNQIREKLESNKAKRKFSKNELFELVEILRKENEELKVQNRTLNERVRVLSQNSRSGYVATIIVTIGGFLLVSSLIFTIVGKIVNH